METKILKVSREALDEAVRLLRSGGLVVYPTETFYGLGANPYDDGAVKNVIKAKGRGGGKPLSLIVKDMEMAEGLVAEFPPWAGELAREFWPGPLTLVLRAGRSMSEHIIGKEGKVGVRVSSNVWASRLTGLCGFPLTATSANLSGAVSSTTPEEALSQLGGKVGLILDNGRLSGTKGSTVLDASVFPPAVIREGEIPTSHLEKTWQRYSPLQP